MVAAACASGLYAPYAPLAYTAATPYLGYGLPYAYPGYNYRGPLSLAPGQPASILGADGRPLDTLDVNLDRASHLTAKAYAGSGIHLLKKRSAVFTAPLTAPLAAPLTAPLALPYAGAAYTTPYAYTPYAGYTGYGYTGYPYAGYGYTAPFGYYKK